MKKAACSSCSSPTPQMILWQNLFRWSKKKGKKRGRKERLFRALPLTQDKNTRQQWKWNINRQYTLTTTNKNKVCVCVCTCMHVCVRASGMHLSMSSCICTHIYVYWMTHKLFSWRMLQQQQEKEEEENPKESKARVKTASSWNHRQAELDAKEEAASWSEKTTAQLQEGIAGRRWRASATEGESASAKALQLKIITIIIRITGWRHQPTMQPTPHGLWDSSDACPLSLS